MVILGELFSLVAAIFLGYSTFNKNKNKMIFFQIIDSFFNAISNLFLMSYSGFITNLFTFFRNILVCEDKFNKFVAFVFILLLLMIGIYFNNRGVIGIFPIMASIEYTICLCIFTSTQKIRFSLVLNLFLWLIYDFYIRAYPMFTMDIIIMIVTLINIIRYKERRCN